METIMSKIYKNLYHDRRTKIPGKRKSEEIKTKIEMQERKKNEPIQIKCNCMD